MTKQILFCILDAIFGKDKFRNSSAGQNHSKRSWLYNTVPSSSLKNSNTGKKKNLVSMKKTILEVFANAGGKFMKLFTVYVAIIFENPCYGMVYYSHCKISCKLKETCSIKVYFFPSLLIFFFCFCYLFLSFHSFCVCA